MIKELYPKVIDCIVMAKLEIVLLHAWFELDRTDMTISIKMDYCRVSYLVLGDGQLFHILSKTRPIPHDEKGDRTGSNPNPILASSLNDRPDGDVGERDSELLHLEIVHLAPFYKNWTIHLIQCL